MGALYERDRNCCKYRLMRHSVFLSFLVIAFFLIIGVSTTGFTLQKPGLSTETESAEQAHHDQQPAAQGKATAVEKEHQPAGGPLPQHGEAALPKEEQHGQEAPHPGAPEHGAAHGGVQGNTHGETSGAAQGQPHGESHGEAHGGTSGAAQGQPHGESHGEAHGEAHVGDHVQLPEISPIPGITFVDTLIGLMDHELHDRILGWRPNGIFITRFTDNINNYQLGVLEAVRFTTIRLKDSLTRLGEADTYDPDLEQALNLFMISATSWWFPSAASSYEQAIDHLKKFRTKLEKGQRNFYYRRDTLVSLLSTYKDQIGNVNRTLVMPVGWWNSDDYFYYAKGVAHVHFEILKVCRVGFKNQLATMHGTDIMDEVLHELLIAEKINPWIVFDASLDGFFANHRANLNAPLSEVGHLLVVLSLL